jgi:N,N'-diacetyllegionaminate synthase
MNVIHVCGREVGPESPVLIIAEAGVNHNGDLKMARQLVREAKACGADCVKFQTFKAERVVTSAAPKAAYQLRVTDPAESQLAMLRKLELSEASHRDLIQLCLDEKISFLSTPYSEEDAVMLANFGVEAFKIASGQLVEHSLLASIARLGRPMILSTGMATMEEINEAVAVVRDAGCTELVVLQCTTNYPSHLKDANLRAMASIRNATGAVIGYSDHTEGVSACIAAVALGASVIEKHFTLDPNLPGPDHRCSSSPVEFRALVRAIREVEAALGDGVKRPTATESANALGMRRSIVARREIRIGEKVGAADFTFKRPATGMAPKRLPELVGLVARQDIAADQQVQPKFFR